jgi:hypothetical protein
MKTSVVVSLTNAPGILFKALAAFTLREVDLSKIESRPDSLGLVGRHLPPSMTSDLTAMGDAVVVDTSNSNDELPEIVPPTVGDVSVRDGLYHASHAPPSPPDG